MSKILKILDITLSYIFEVLGFILMAVVLCFPVLGVLFTMIATEDLVNKISLKYPSLGLLLSMLFIVLSQSPILLILGYFTYRSN